MTFWNENKTKAASPKVDRRRGRPGKRRFGLRPAVTGLEARTMLSLTPTSTVVTSLASSIYYSQTAQFKFRRKEGVRRAARRVKIAPSDRS
jgi:hypothetical protein